MKEEEPSLPSRDSGRDKDKRKKKSKRHAHVGPNARAFKAGLAFCPVCDAERILSLTDDEKESERASRAKK